MHSNVRQLFPGAAVAIFFTVAFAALAQDTKSAVPAVTDQAGTAAGATTGAAADSAAAAPASEARPDGELRRLDAAPSEPPDASESKADLPRRPRPLGRRAGSGNRGGNERIAIGGDAVLAEDDAAEAVVAVFGSATSAGRVSDAVVAILGNARATGTVGDAVVAVLGNAYVNNRVGDAVVAVLGNVELGPRAEVMGDVVSVGGTITRHPDATVHGEVQNISFGHLNFGHVDGLREWFRHAVLLGRPLAIGPHLAWAWVIAFCFLGLYVLLAALFRPAVEQCTLTLSTRPGYSILTTVLTVLLIPVTIVLLCFTVVGIALVPFVIMALLVAALFGKVVMLNWLGSRFTRFFGEGVMRHVAMAVLLGGLIVLGLYLVPFVGFLVFKLLAWLGIGVVIYTLILRMKREARSVPATPAAAMAGGAAPAAGFYGDPLGAPPMMEATGAPPPSPLFSAATLPRAGFWIRVLALIIDVIVVGLVMGFTQKLMPSFLRHDFGPGLLPVLALYGALLWKMRGTTIGGIVCGLKVVRLDDRPIDWATAIVRALGCFLSLVVAGLGFIWVAFDAEKQSWHDKIAGTTVVRVPKGVSLL